VQGAHHDRHGAGLLHRRLHHRGALVGEQLRRLAHHPEDEHPSRTRLYDEAHESLERLQIELAGAIKRAW
jgi:hypothetical protein